MVVEPPTPPSASPPSEADRERSRHAAAAAIIPERTTCLPPVLQDPNGPRLELGQVGVDAVLCAIDSDNTRRLGVLACWTIDLAGPARQGALIPTTTTPLIGHSARVLLDGRCARGFCLPDRADAPRDGAVVMAWSSDRSAVAVLAEGTLHVFDAGSHHLESQFPAAGGGGVVPRSPVDVHWVGETLFVEVDEGELSSVWRFARDGTPIGLLQVPGEPRATRPKFGSSFVVLAPDRVAIEERGFSRLLIYDVTSEKATIAGDLSTLGPCTAAEFAALWSTGLIGPPSGACAKYVSARAPFIGADAVWGRRNLLVLLRGPRLGELAVLDPSTLVEHDVIHLPWCPASSH